MSEARPTPKPWQRYYYEHPARFAALVWGALTPIPVAFALIVHGNTTLILWITFGAVNITAEAFQWGPRPRRRRQYEQRFGLVEPDEHETIQDGTAQGDEVDNGPTPATT